MIYIDEVKLNETRVVIRPDYFNMSKNYWLYSDKWRDQDIAKGECLVLGGEYTIWKIINQAIYLQDKYCKYETPNTVSADDLVLASEYLRCSFKNGDTVKPNNQFDFDSFKSELTAYYEKYFSKNFKFKVVGILNQRYIFIGYEPFSDFSIPFPCSDFDLLNPGITGLPLKIDGVRRSQ